MVRRIFALLAAFAMVLGVSLSAFAAQTVEERRARQLAEAQKYPSQASEALNRKEFDAAIELFTKAINSRAFNDQPEFMGELYFGRGTAHRLKQDCNAAIPDFLKALETASEGDIHFSLAICHLVLKQDDLALAALDKAIKVDPDAVMYRNARCKLLYNKRDFAGALPDCQKALAGIANDKDLLIATAQSAEQVGNRPLAAEVYRKLLAADPGNTIAAEGLKRVGS